LKNICVQVESEKEKICFYLMEEVLHESTIVSFLDGPDHGQVPNAVHSSAGAKRFGYEKALVGGVTVYSWCVSSILKVFNRI
jgi:hypothetical protein